MLAPALRLAREHLQGAWCGVVLQEKYASDLKVASVADAILPEIDESQPFGIQVRRWRQRYRESNIDCVVFHRFTRPDLPAALAAVLEGVPHRVGGTDKGVQALMTSVYTPSQREKVVEHHWNLISSWLSLAFPIPPQLQWPQLFSLPDRALKYDVVIAPFAQHSKIWPFECWHVLLFELRALGQRVALSASSSEGIRADELLRDFPWVDNLCHQSTSLAFLFETVQTTASIITVDTGIRHVAAMLNVPCVVIGHGREHRRIMETYVPTERYVWNPMPCAPCGAEPCPLGHLRCIRDISPETVLAAWKSLTLKRLPAR